VVLTGSALPSQEVAGQGPAPAAYLGARYTPTETHIESIPVSAIRPSWSHVLILRRDNQPPDVLREVGANQFYGAQFEVAADLDGDGRDERAVVGVYRTVNNDFGRFLLILDHADGGGWRPVFTCAFLGDPGSSILFRRPAAETGRAHFLHAFCMQCDVLVDVFWDQGYRIVGAGGPRGEPFVVPCS
jgi:hypothetical protein